MAGYSGGRKVIAPGVAGKATITTFHNAEFMGHPLAANCVLDGNPLHQEQLEIVGLLGGAYAVNTVIDERRRVALVNFGEIVQSHLAAVEFIRAYAEVPVPRRYHTVLTSRPPATRWTKPITKRVKGMVGPLDILAPGGRLIIASACDRGVGFRRLRRRATTLVRPLAVRRFYARFAPASRPKSMNGKNPDATQAAGGRPGAAV